VYPAPFAYLAPTSIPEALDSLVDLRDEEPKILAGGQSLIPLMKLRFAQPAYVVDINRIAELRGVRRDDDGGLRIGALTRERELEDAEVVRQRYPILFDTATVIADPLVRNLATVGGNLAHGDPANDHPATMIALGAEVVAVGPGGARRIPIEEFFTGLFETVLEPTEILTQIRIPPPPAGTGAAYVKYERQAGDFAVAGAAVNLTAIDGVVARARVALTNVGSTPYRAHDVERVLAGRRPSAGDLRAAGALAADGLDLYDELSSPADYKRRVVTAVVARALARALARAGGWP
jgi:carbon-monoxide dehydrogenase medium subunit